MIQTRDAYNVTSTVPTDTKIQMGIRTEDMAHIMGVLTDLYSDKLLAVIREYSTNAFDAHRDAGIDAPIRVTLPTALTPFLTIADSGDGLGEDDIREVYSQYGRSTKRESNDVVGMLGLGCKSALTYTSQFTVTSVKDGVKTVVIVSREEDGSGSMTPLTSEATDEPSGTEVKVAIQRNDYYRAEQIANDFFSVWEEGTVLVNGQAPKRFDGLRITDDLYVVQQGESRVVMGNVPYPAPDLDDLCPMGSILAFVPIGAVNFPPSREALMETKQTKDTIAAIRSTFEVEAKKAIQREIDKAASPAEAVKLAVEWSRYLPDPNGGYGRRTPSLSGFTFGGSSLPTYIESDKTMPFTTSSNSGYRLGSSSTAEQIFVGEWPTTVWVHGFTPGKFTAQHKRKLIMACQQRGILDATNTNKAVTMFVCIHGPMPKEADQPAVKFLDSNRILDWEDVRKLQLSPRTAQASSGKPYRIPGSYDLYTEDGYEHGVPGDKIRTSVPVFYFRGNRWQINRYAQVMKQHYKRFTIVLLTQNRIEKFKRNVPKAKTVREAIEAKRDAWMKSLTPDQRDAITLQDNYAAGGMDELDAGKVDDPALQRGIKLRQMDVADLMKQRKAFAQVVGVPTIDTQIENPLDKYPLFETYGKPMDHVYAYLNWHYAESSK